MNIATSVPTTQAPVPPALIDGVTQQQINQVVREHVTKGRAKKPSAAEASAPSKQQIAIGLAIDMLNQNYLTMFSVLMDETSKTHDEGVLDALNLIEIGKSEIQRMKAKRYSDFDDCSADLVKIGALNRAIEAACGDRNDLVGRFASTKSSHVDTLLSLIEVAA